MIFRHCGLAVLALAIATVAVQSSLGQVPLLSVKDPNVVEEFDIDISRDRLILVPVKMGDKTYRFALDTGASNHFFDSSFRSRLGPIRETVAIKTPNGGGQAELFDSPEAFLGSFNLQTAEGVVCSDLGPIRQATGADIKGIIGMTFLKKHVVRIDLDKGKLAILNKAALDLGKPILLSYKSSIPSIGFELPYLGERHFLVDTGCNLSLTMRTSDFDSLLNRQEIKMLGDMNSTDMFRIRRLRKGVVRKASIDDIDLREVPVAECATPEIRVGLHFLRRYRCTFDFPNNALYLSENGLFSNSPR